MPPIFIRRHVKIIYTLTRVSASFNMRIVAGHCDTKIKNTVLVYIKYTCLAVN